MALDPRSLLFMAAIMASFMAVVLFFMRRSFPAHIRGIGLWALAPVAWVTAAALLGMRGLIPDFASIVLGNVLTVAGSVLFYLGCKRFYGQPTHQWRWGAAVLAEAVVLAWMTHLAPWPGGRMVVFTAMMLAVFGSNLHFMLRHGEPRFPARLVNCVLALQIGVLLVRLMAALTGQASNQLLDTSLIQIVYLGSYAMFVLMLSIGAVLLATDRLTRELEHLATHDALTDALNRRAILQRCADEVERCRRFGKGLAVLMLNLQPLQDRERHRRPPARRRRTGPLRPQRGPHPAPHRPPGPLRRRRISGAAARNRPARRPANRPTHPRRPGHRPRAGLPYQHRRQHLGRPTGQPGRPARARRPGAVPGQGARPQPDLRGVRAGPSAASRLPKIAVCI